MDDHDEHTSIAPPGWEEALEAGRADLAAGRTVPAEAVLKRMQEAIDRLECAQEPADRTA